MRLADVAAAQVRGRHGRRDQRQWRARHQRGRARAEVERQVQCQGRVQLRHAQAGHVHEQADEEKQLGDRRDDGDHQEGRRTGRRSRSRGGPRGLCPGIL